MKDVGRMLWNQWDVIEVKSLVPDDMDVWKEDKELIRLSRNQALRKFRYAEIPTDEYGYTAMNEFNSLLKPGDALTEKEVGEVVSTLKPKLDAVWGFDVPARVRVVKAETFLDEFNKDQRKTNEKLKPEFRLPDLKSAPCAAADHQIGEVVLPDRYGVTYAVAKDRGLADARDRDYVARLEFVGRDLFRWPREVLEITLAEELNHLAFRQVRSELGEGYIASVNALEPGQVGAISNYNETIARLISYKFFSQSPQHALPLMDDRLKNIWNNAQRRAVYRALRFLDGKGVPMSEIAMVDLATVLSSQHQYAIGLITYNKHPNYRAKKEAEQRIKTRYQL